MVIHLAILILLALFQAADAQAAPQPRNQCLGCHAVHYRDQGDCRDCHRGNPASARRNIAHLGLIPGRFARFRSAADPLVQEGNRLLEQFACRRCHVIGGRGNRLAASLDDVTAMKGPQELVRSIGSPALGMPLFRLSEGQMTALVTGLYAGGMTVKRGPERPQVVFFQERDGKGPDLFSRKCGSCHRILSERLGALGRSDSGPNLSGLFTQYYPKTFRNRERWHAEGLKQWLENPRNVRRLSTMPPVVLTAEELREIVDILKVTAQQ